MVHILIAKDFYCVHYVQSNIILKAPKVAKECENRTSFLLA